MFRLILELVRIIAIFAILGSLIGSLVKLMYVSMEINVDETTGGWIVGIAIYILLFVFYRNRLQFSGFYNGEGNKKLPKKLSISLISFSIVMIAVAPFIR
jgi:uncharacterized membrane protein